MRWILLSLLLSTLADRANELFRDNHLDRSSVFESDAKEVTATISEADAILAANKWAARLYKDPLIQFETIEFGRCQSDFC
jgi:hypothetical protein